MKRILTFTLILISYLSFSQSTYLSFTKSKSKAGIQNTVPVREINDQGQQFCEVDFEFPGAFVSEKSYNEHGDFTYINIKGFASNNTPGKPALPIRNNIVALPGGKDNTRIEIIEQSYIEYDNYRIHPALKPASDTYGASEPEFEMDYKLYATNAFYPANVVEINNFRKLRDIPIASVKVCPVQYNPVTNKIRVYSKIKYRITFTKQVDLRAKLQANTAKYNGYIKSLLINPSALPEQSNIKAIYDKDRKDYIILTHTEFEEAATKLAIWKRQLGYTVEVVSRDDWTSELIEFVLKERYTSWTPKPDYFVIIGDHEGEFPVPGKIMIDGSTKFASDNRYSCMDGVDDYEPDIAKGRIPARTKADANLIVQRIINYEKNPPTDQSFYNTTLNCAYFQDDENDGYATRRFCQTSEEVKEHMLDQGYNVNRVYATSSDNPTNWNDGRYSGGEVMPSELHKPGFPWVPAGGGKDDIVREWNDGRFLIFHRDHGYSGGRGWADPHFMNDNIPELNNPDELPVVFSINCHTGQFIEPECFSELLMTNETGGAVGVLSAAQSSYSGSNDALVLGFYDAIWPGVVVNFTGSGGENVDAPQHESIYNMGDILNYGLMRMLETWPAGQDEYQCDLYHYFGDPTMEIRTEFPQTVTATIPTTIQCDKTSLSISSCNVEDALVTICINDRLIAKTILVNGEGTLNFDPLGNNNDGAIVTIYGHNTVPLIKNVAITGSCNLAPMAAFESEQYIVSTSTTMQINDLSKYQPTSWEWSFSPSTVVFVDGTSANSQNPKIQFTNSSLYSVTLKASNSNGNNTKTKTDYIVAKAGAPTNLSSNVKSSSQIDLMWEKNFEGNDIMIAFNTDGVFGTPVDGTNYSVGNNIDGGGEIAYRGSATNFIHENLPEFTYTHYKLWSYTSNNEYSYIGATLSDQTAKSLETPYIETFTSGVKPDLVKGWSVNENSNVPWETISYTSTSLGLGQYNSNGFMADDWVFTPALELIAGEEYRISFKVKGANENLIVNYGKAPEPSAMNKGIIFNQAGIDSEINVINSITPTESGVYFIGFFHHGVAKEIEIDDVNIIKLSSTNSAYWLGGTTGSEQDWLTATNWSGDQLPTSISDVYISSGISYYPVINGTASSKDVFIMDDAKLTIGEGANFTVNGNFWCGGGTSGEFEMNGGIVTITENYCGNENSVTDINDGILNIGGSWLRDLRDGYHFTRGIGQFSGGEINITKSVAFGGNSRWHGTMDGPVIFRVGHKHRTAAVNWDISDGTVELTGAYPDDNPTIYSSMDTSIYYNLIINGPGESFLHSNSTVSVLYVKNNLIIENGVLNITDLQDKFQVDGDMIIKSGQTFTANGLGGHFVNGDLIIECGATVINQEDITVGGSIINFCGEPKAEFIANVSTVNVGNEISFTDRSLNTPTAWEWTFEGGTPATSTDQNPTVTYSNIGAYSVSLKVTNSTDNNTITKTDYINVLASDNSLVANFNSNKYSLNVNETVNFTDLSTNNPTSWEWTFEGGTPEISTDQNPTVTYTNSGVYSVTLKSTNANNSNEIIKSNCIVVNPNVIATVADFTSSQTVVTEGNSIVFSDLSSNEPLSLLWEFEGGSPATSSDASPEVTYNKHGLFNVKLTAMNAMGSSEIIKSGHIQVLAKLKSPKADFNANNRVIKSGGNILFNDISTNNPTSWEWIFEGGTPSTSTEQNPAVSYANEGNYNVSLIARNDYGEGQKTVSEFITVSNTSQTYCPHSYTYNLGTTTYIALMRFADLENTSTYTKDSIRHQDFTNLAATVEPGKTYTFEVEGGPNPPGWEHLTVWIDWNNNGVLEQSSPELAVFNNGNSTQRIHEITVPADAVAGRVLMRVLAATDIYGESDPCGDYYIHRGETEDYSVNICKSGNGSSAIFSASPISIEPTESTTFYDASSNNPTSWSWTFEGGTPATSVEQNPVVSYASAGIYSATLVTTNKDGESTRTEDKFIYVGNSDLVANFIADKTSLTQGESVNFTDQTEGYVSSWNWIFEGGEPATSTEQNPTVVYNIPGQYIVQLTVENSDVSDTKVVESYINVASYVLVNNISVSGDNIIDEDNGTALLSATVLPENAHDRSIRWSSSNSNVAMVDTNGLVTAVTDGTVEITATADDNSGVYGTLSVTISNQIISVTSISITGNTSIDVNSGTINLSYSVLPENATNQSASWSSSDIAIASVNENGLVTAHTNGIVTITITSNEDEGITNTHEVTITNQTSGLNTMNKISDVLITPNPFTSKMQISISVEKEKLVDIKLHNALGEYVYTKKVSLTKGENNITVSPSIETGIYYLSIYSEDDRVTKKVIKF